MKLIKVAPKPRRSGGVNLQTVRGIAARRGIYFGRRAHAFRPRGGHRVGDFEGEGWTSSGWKPFSKKIKTTTIGLSETPVPCWRFSQRTPQRSVVSALIVAVQQVSPTGR